MNTTPKFMPLGSSVSVHHMPEAYHDEWSRLRKAERKAFRLACASGCDCGSWAKWERAAKRLRDCENKHNTD